MSAPCCTCGCGPGGIDRETLEVAAALNAETVAGLQSHARKVESDRARLAFALGQLLGQLEYAEGNAERFLIQPDSGCMDCTAGTTPTKYQTGLCPRHAAERLLKELSK